MVNMGNVWDRATEFLSDNLGAVVPVALLTIFVPQSISGAIKLAGTAVAPGLGQAIVLALLLPILWGQLAITALALRPDAGRGAAQSTATRRFLQYLLAMLILFGAIVVLFLVPWLDKSRVKSYRYRGKLSWLMLGIFVVCFIWLGKIGSGPGTDPSEVIIGRILTFLYFVFFITMPLWTKLDNTRPVPERVTTHD